MKKLMTWSVFAAAVLAGPIARADAPFNPDCHLEAINASLDSVRDQVKSSPALGHAGGHYKHALEDLEKLRKQLHAGCHAWNQGLKK